MKKTIMMMTLFVSVVLTSCGGGSSEDTNTDANSSNKSYEMVFDVPSLIDKNVDEIVQILGKPEYDDEPTELQIKSGIVEWEKSFQKDGYELLVTYNAKTRKVIDFFVPTNSSTGMTDNIDELIQVSNVKNNTSLKVEPVKTLKNPKEFTGVRISK